jgi:hypothetical protein
MVVGKSRNSQEDESGASDEDISDETPRNKSKKRSSKDDDDDSQVCSCGPVFGECPICTVLRAGCTECPITYHFCHTKELMFVSDFFVAR